MEHIVCLERGETLFSGKACPRVIDGLRVYQVSAHLAIVQCSIRYAKAMCSLFSMIVYIRHGAKRVVAC